MNKLLKAIYRLIPLKKQIFSIIRLFKPSHAIYQHLYFKGPFKVDVDQRRSFTLMHHGYSLENEVFWTGLKGNWEAQSLQLWIELCKKSKVIFDIGANTGVYSLIAKTVNPASEVYAFEPVQRTFQLLQQNIRQNNYQIAAINKAVSTKDGVAIIGDNTSDEHQYGATLNEKFMGGITYQVETVTLNTFIKENRLTKVDLMKIDVEAYEPEVLEGFLTSLKEYKPAMLIEFVQDEPAEKIDEMLAGSGYIYFNINEKTGPRRVSNITKSDHFNFLICMPHVAKSLGLPVAT